VIKAPVKRPVWFEQSAHNPPFEEPALFNQTLIDLLKPGKTTDKLSEAGS
jgi:proline iminopeptidase